MRIDSHAHVFTPRYAASLGAMAPPVPAPLDGLRRTMDRYGIDRAVISTGPPGAPTSEIARIANEDLAKIARDEPDTFASIASLPLDDSDAALAELERALDELALDGVLLLSNFRGRYLGDPAFEPLLAELDRRNAYAFLHPSIPPYDLPLAHPPWLYEFTFDTTRALTNLIYTGALERYPGIRLQVAHVGGTAPFIAHRIASLASREPAAAAEAPAGALTYLKRLYYDTGLANNAPALAAMLEITSVDNIVFGTDWPFADLPTEGDDPAPGLDHLGKLRGAVEQNARTLVKRWTVETV